MAAGDQLNIRSLLRPGLLAAFVLTAAASFLCGVLVPLDLPFGASATPAPTEVAPPTLSPTQLAIKLDVFPNMTVYWDRSLWEAAVGPITATEDFESEAAGYGRIPLPYATANGFLFEGSSTAQILVGSNLLDSGTLLHFRDFEDGMRILFPNPEPVRAFGFDYKASETWQLHAGGNLVTIPDGTRGFVGIEMLEAGIAEFRLSSAERAQGGLTVDNLSMADAPHP